MMTQTTEMSDTSPDSESVPEFNAEEAVTELQELLPQLESECDDARRCLSVISENFHVAKVRLEAMLKTGHKDPPTIAEFHYAVSEIRNNLTPVVEAIRQIEAATNEVARGAQGLPRS